MFRILSIQRLLNHSDTFAKLKGYKEVFCVDNSPDMFKPDGSISQTDLARKVLEAIYARHLQTVLTPAEFESLAPGQEKSKGASNEPWISAAIDIKRHFLVNAMEATA